MGFPSLKRAETCETTTTDTSSLDYEKATTRHREFAPVEEVIKEEDEDNVGQAEYIKSTKQAEIVRRYLLFTVSNLVLTRVYSTDSGGEQGHRPPDRSLRPPAVRVHSLSASRSPVAQT